MVLPSTVILGAAVALAGEPGVSPSASPQAEDGSSAFRKVAPGLLQLGKVQLDQNRRTVSFPISVNQRTGVVEYLLVTTTGKTHESVFNTETEPQHIHMALLLLGARPAYSNDFPRDLTVPVPGERVDLAVRWTANGRTSIQPAEDFVITTNNQQRLTRGPWAYNGSFVTDRRFLAQQEGSIVSIQIDPVALINNPRPGRENDDLHHVNTSAMPPDQTPLEICITLSSKPSDTGTAANKAAGPTSIPSRTP